MLDKLKKNYYLLIITFLLIYFFFNLLDGNRGLISNLEKKKIYKDLKLWADMDKDGQVGEGELRTLEEMGVKSIFLAE